MRPLRNGRESVVVAGVTGGIGSWVLNKYMGSHVAVNINKQTTRVKFTPREETVEWFTRTLAKGFCHITTMNSPTLLHIELCYIDLCFQVSQIAF